MTHFAMHAEKWLDGSTQQELKDDEQACFVKMLARAALTGADPPGEIYFVNDEHLAIQIRCSLELTQRTAEKCKKYKKIKISPKKSENVFVLSFPKWKNYQHIYLHQKAYRARQKALKEKQKKQYETGTKKDNHDITGYSTLCNKIRDDKRGEKNDNIGGGEDEDKLPPIPKNLPFKIQDKLQELRASIREYQRRVTLTDDEIREKHRYLWTGCDEEELDSRVKHYREENEASLKREIGEFKKTVSDYSDEA